MKALNLNLKHALVAFALPLLAACSPVGFSQAEQKSTNDAAGNPIDPIDGGTCSVESVSRMTKILFVVDTSGSNVKASRNPGSRECSPSDPDYAQCTPPTDPQKAFRAGAIQNFFSRYQSKTNFRWGLVTFAGTSASSLIQDMNTDLTSDASEMQMAINDFKRMQDNGGTPYRSALQLAKRIIQDDVAAESDKSAQYVVIFLSDGFPTDYGSDDGSFDSAGMQQDISRMMSTAPGRVSLSTIYYSQKADMNAMQVLAKMASLGGGQSANVNDPSNSSISIDDVIPGQVCN